MKAIGPTFGDELKAAGITDWRFSWSSDGTISFDPACTQAALVEQTYAAHDPAKKSQDQILAEKIAVGYVDATLNVTLAIDETSQGRITSVGAAAGIAVATNSASGKTFVFPTLGTPYTAPNAQAAYDLSERCREYVQGIIAAAAAGTLTP